jgi:serine/threonine-protein kinase
MSNVPLDAGAIVDGRFRVESVLGEGGHATVYRAKHVWLGRPTALKVAREPSERFRRTVLIEAETLARLSHPNIVRIYDAGVLAEGTAFASAELIVGATLRQLIARTTCAVRDVLRTLAAITSALETLHAEGVIHRDIKPDNIMVPDGKTQPSFTAATLIDFGLVGHLGTRGRRQERRTLAGRVSGTTSYMAPEQLCGRQQSIATDVYGIGAVLFEALVGYPPMVEHGTIVRYDLDVGGKQMALSLVPERLANEVAVPTVVSTLGGAIVDLLKTALRHDAAERFQTATELKRALENAIEAVGPTELLPWRRPGTAEGPFNGGKEASARSAR